MERLAQFVSSRKITQSLRKLIALGGSDGHPEGIYTVLRSMFTLEQSQSLISATFSRSNDCSHPLDPLTRALELHQTDTVQAWSALELGNYLRDTLLRDTDAMSMAHGLEVREPFLDHHLVEQVMTLPGHVKLRMGKKKPHLVAAVPELPDEVIRRKKMGFTLPFDVWLRGPLKPWVEDRLLGSGDRSRCLDAGAVGALWRAFLSNGSHVSHSRIWCLASLLDWMDRYRVEA